MRTSAQTTPLSVSGSRLLTNHEQTLSPRPHVFRTNVDHIGPFVSRQLRCSLGFIFKQSLSGRERARRPERPPRARRDLRDRVASDFGPTPSRDTGRLDFTNGHFWVPPFVVSKFSHPVSPAIGFITRADPHREIEPARGPEGLGEVGSGTWTKSRWMRPKVHTHPRGSVVVFLFTRVFQTDRSPLAIAHGSTFGFLKV